jgi:hypothetical protein
MMVVMMMMMLVPIMMMIMVMVMRLMKLMRLMKMMRMMRMLRVMRTMHDDGVMMRKKMTKKMLKNRRRIDEGDGKKDDEDDEDDKDDEDEDGVCWLLTMYIDYFYCQQLFGRNPLQVLRENCFKQKFVHTGRILHTETFTHRHTGALYTNASLRTKLVHTEPLSQGCFLHTEDFDGRFSTQITFTPSRLLRLDRQTLSHANVFTRKSLDIQMLLQEKQLYLSFRQSTHVFRRTGSPGQIKSHF